MSVDVVLLKSLIDYLEEYDNEFDNNDLREFSSYLSDKLIISNLPPKSNYKKEDFKKYKSFAEVEFSTLLAGLFRFAKHYTKKALSETNIKTLDEFGFLSTLLREESMLKKELIDTHLMEVSSGSEIIKRMINNGLIYEYPDEKDKRAKRISLTEEGVKEVMSSFDSMQVAAEIIMGNLTDEEVQATLKVMNKLTYFHNHIHKDDKTSSLSSVADKYLKDK
ncbi:MAG: hypothetical protein C0598_07690 [Marinilabiliales bacterium]|nr:MAG: hypothetical protein C0598_07690 [Marinilabiliales bacterium]